MSRRHRFLTLGLALVLGPAIGGASPAVSVARLTDAATTTKALTTDTLNPPTSLAAIGGVSAALTWTATTSTYATGYEMRRATVSGGPYSLVTTVTPRTIVAATDTPAASGTYYYVLRSDFQNWISVDSNQASAVVLLPPTATGFKPCTGTSNSADTGGDGNGYETSPANGCAADLAVATDANSGTTTTISCTNTGKDRHRFWDYGLGIPAAVNSVGGIQVRVNEGISSISGTNQICIELSSNGGSTWTTAKSVALTATAITTYNLGATNDTWGRSWAGSDFSNTNFRVRITDVSSATTKSFLLDYVAVQVTYIP
ncbi:MAG TPA: hypothetical protein VE640_07370 [Candidatus Bathyarchaeia archaeon]|jgi:hypothetical protein|nr:hypothetical protein [Candidatus Bathyarchaeia archaeon]